MNDIVKHYREKHPWLDSIAGFIPGVGEAQDIQDLAYAVKDKDWLTAGISLAGVLIPGLTGGQMTKLYKALKPKLSKALLDKGWKIADNGVTILDPKGGRWRQAQINGERKLQREENFLKDKASEEQKLKDQETKASNERKLKQKIKKFNDTAEEFGKRTGFYSFNTEAWQAGIPKSARMNQEQLELYIDKGAPAIMKHYDTLINNGKKANPNGPALRRTADGKYQAYYETGLALKGKWANKYRAGWRDVSNLEAELYLIETSPNAAGKFVQTGIPMYRGISSAMIPEFLSYSRVQPWYNSNIANASHYTGKNGLAFFGAPIRTPETKVFITGQSNPNSTLQHWRMTDSDDSMSGYVTGGKGSINISEIPVIDEMVKGVYKDQTRGFATLLGEGVRVKALKGGTGLFDLSQMNPLLYNGGKLLKRRSK